MNFSFLTRLLAVFAAVFAVGCDLSDNHGPITAFTDESQRSLLLSSEQADPSKSRVILFVTEWCPACKSLEYELKAEKIDFVRLDIEQNRLAGYTFERLATMSGSRGIPKIVVDNDLVSRSELFRRVKGAG